MIQSVGTVPLESSIIKCLKGAKKEIIMSSEDRKIMEKIQFMHFRCLDGTEIYPKGGMTFCYYPIPDENRAIVCGSICSPKENFKRKIGCNVSLGRAKKHVKSGISGGNILIGINVPKMSMLEFRDLAAECAEVEWRDIDSDNEEKVETIGHVSKSRKETVVNNS